MAIKPKRLFFRSEKQSFSFVNFENLFKFNANRAASAKSSSISFLSPRRGRSTSQIQERGKRIKMLSVLKSEVLQRIFEEMVLYLLKKRCTRKLLAEGCSRITFRNRSKKGIKETFEKAIRSFSMTRVSFSKKKSGWLNSLERLRDRLRSSKL